MRISDWSSDVCSSDLMNRPLWDIYIIEGLDRIEGIPPGSFAMLHRVHHAAVDGASGAHAFIAMSDIDAAGTPAIAAPPPVESLGRAPSSAESVTRAWGSEGQPSELPSQMRISK